MQMTGTIRDSIRGLIGRVPAGLVIALAAVGFWFLSRGMTLGTGTVVGYAEEQVHQVAPLQAGRVKSVAVRLGQAVKAGDVLVQLDTRPLELRRERLQAELMQARSMLVSERDVESARLQRSQIQAVSAYVDESRARAELRTLEQQVKRLTWLRSRNLVKASELEAAQRRQRALIADLQARPTGTSRELEQMGRRPRPATEQEQRLEDRLAPYRAAVAVAESGLRELEYSITEQTLRAPVDGTVGAILQRPGDVLAAGTPVLSVVTMRPGHVVAYVPERQVLAFVAGARVSVHRSGLLSSSLRGQVVEQAPAVEELPLRARRSFSVPVWGRRVVIKLDDPVPLFPGEAFRVSPR